MDPFTEVRILAGQPAVPIGGDVPEWSGSGLQNRVHGFDSRRRLHTRRACPRGTRSAAALHMEWLNGFLLARRRLAWAAALALAMLLAACNEGGNGGGSPY